MKSIAACVFVFLAISSATTGVAALPSVETGITDLLRCYYWAMLNEHPDSIGPLVRDSNREDASNTPAGTRLRSNLSLEVVDRYPISAANGTFAPGLGNTYCPEISLYDRKTGLNVGFRYQKYRPTSSFSRCEDIPGEATYAVIGDVSSPTHYSLSYEGGDCTMRIIDHVADSPYNGGYFPL